jgi:metal-responsive CopG/Arc/MetJ family transcriptional regulator
MMGKSRIKIMAAKMIKLSISVDAEVAEWMDKQIEKRIYRNRSHAFDVAGHLLMTSEKSQA